MVSLRHANWSRGAMALFVFFFAGWFLILIHSIYKNDIFLHVNLRYRICSPLCWLLAIASYDCSIKQVGFLHIANPIFIPNLCWFPASLTDRLVPCIALQAHCRLTLVDSPAAFAVAKCVASASHSAPPEVVSYAEGGKNDNMISIVYRVEFIACWNRFETYSENN